MQVADSQVRVTLCHREPAMTEQLGDISERRSRLS
jgi:hypothetical protein